LQVVEAAGLTVERSTYAFTTVFPFFVAERAQRRLRERAGHKPPAGLTPVPTGIDRLLMRLSGVDRRMLRRWDLPFGSSVFVAALKPPR
jgi:hypothetical protein